MKKVIVLFLLVSASLLLVACSATGPLQPAGNNRSGGNQATPKTDAHVANGEQIYFTGADKQGNRISHTGGPNLSGMSGSYLTCASCHGPVAHGVQHVMNTQTMDAPPIYYDALNSMMMEESQSTQAPREYTLDDFRIAVIDGKHPDGGTMGTDMPLWQMSDQDLADLFTFLKTIQK